MDTFMVVVALVLVFCCFLAFGTDMQSWMSLQKKLKVLAEDCAEYAALCIDEERSMQEGRIIIDREKAEESADRLCDLSEIYRLFPGTESLSAELSFPDDSKAEVRIVWRGAGIFRSIKSEIKEAARKAAYGWEY